MGEQPPKLLERMSNVLRRQFYAHPTETADIHWIKRYIYFNRTEDGEFRHPADMGVAEVEAFLAVIEQFHADGREGDLSLYTVLEQ